MKKFNFNIILFVFAFLFIVLGFNNEYYMYFKSVVYDGLQDIKANKSVMESIQTTKSKIERISEDKLRYHNTLMDIDSIRQNLLNTETIYKDDDVLIKSKEGMLSAPHEELLTEAELEKIASNFAELKDKSEANGAGFLYVAIPSKPDYLDFPLNVENFSAQNLDNFISVLDKNKIPVLDMRSVFSKYDYKDLYFYTDHHWTPKAGFLTVESILNDLNARYGIEYNKEYCDINNYNVKTYKNYFLGSTGKKTGTYFTWHGADDFDLITPKFDTDFTEMQPIKDQIRKGKFEDTVLYMEHIKEKDFYGKSPYCVYSGGDFRLQIMKNNNNINGKKVLLIRDSYACVAAPFLALNMSEVHVTDLRDMNFFVGERINVYEYIEEIDPDIVMVLYNGVYSFEAAIGSYDFGE